MPRKNMAGNPVGTLTSSFDYRLPERLIAQSASAVRDSSRLLVIDKGSGRILHGKKFSELPLFMREGDVLVINDTRVIKARLSGRKIPAGGAVEFLLLKNISGGRWETLIKPSRRVSEGTRVSFGRASAEVIKSRGNGRWEADFSCPGDFAEFLDKTGAAPLPPYIRDGTGKGTGERYQTVYAEMPGASAAPTAGLHFTRELLDRIQLMGVLTARITLHTGAGTFLPVREKFAEDHSMDDEYYRVSPETARLINGRNPGARVFAVGTTCVRALETASDPDGNVAAGEGGTDIFITPGFKFKCVDALITNFHPPRSTTLMLTAAFAGKELLMKAYAEAVDREYRFLSLGDATLVTHAGGGRV